MAKTKVSSKPRSAKASAKPKPSKTKARVAAKKPTKATSKSASKKTRNMDTKSSIDIQKLYASFEEWVAKKAARVEFAPPAKPSDLDALEAAIGHALPDDLRKALEIHDGGPQIGNYGLIPASRIQKRHASGMKIAEQPSKGGGTCRPVKWSSGWIPFAEDGSLNYLCIDLDPGPKGKVGQVIRWERSTAGADAARWSTFGEWFETVVHACLAGEIEFDDAKNITFLTSPNAR